MKNKKSTKENHWWLFIIAFILLILGTYLFALGFLMIFSSIILSAYLAHKSNIITISLDDSIVPNIFLIIFGMILLSLQYFLSAGAFGDIDIYSISPLDGLMVVVIGIISTVKKIHEQWKYNKSI